MLSRTFLFLLAGFLFNCSQSPTNAQMAEDAYFPMPSTDAKVVSSLEHDFVVQTVVEDLDIPWGMAFLPNGNMLITERTGNLRLVEKGKLRSAPIKNVPEVYTNGQGGLLDVTLHPNYETNGWIYLSYSNPGEGGGHTAIMRAKLRDYALVETELLFEAGPFTNSRVHFGSRITFDADGFMYFSVGDRGQKENAQRLDHNSGKVYRLHDDGRIPTDNPFVSTENAKPEIWSYGHRNPQGMVTHPKTGIIWAHEHGPRGGDELNIIKKAANFGWPEITFGINYNGTIITNDTAKAGMEQPEYYWVPSIAPCGMDFVHNSKFDQWEGDLFVGSLSFATLYRYEMNEDKVVGEEKLFVGEGRIRDVKQGPDGYIYVANETTRSIYRLIPQK